MNEELDTRLRENRYEPTGLELDELKRRATSQASRGTRARRAGSPRLVSSFLALALVMSGGSAVLAGASGTSSGGQPSASISQYEQLVLGERVIPGNARLLGPTGCAGKAFNASVRGTNVAKVTFKLDGKTIKTLTAPNRAGQFVVRVNPLRMKIGVHRMVVNVSYKPATKKAAQTFRLSFKRCAKKLAAPRFTG